MVRECYEILLYLALFEESWGGKGGEEEELLLIGRIGIYFAK